MTLSALLLLALPVLSSASLHGTENITENDLNGNPKATVDTSLLRKLSILSASTFRQKKQVRPSSSVAAERDVLLQWVTFEGFLPSDAVSVYNHYVGRTDYVCKHGCATGFYTPTKGPYCYYAHSTEELKGTPFEMLVNKDNFELLSWKDDSSGSVPENSVCSCPGRVCVGMNEYGLGKVNIPDQAFFLPYNGYEYRYTDYKVLTTSDDIVSQQFYDVQYNIKEHKISLSAAEVMFQSSIKNYDCEPMEKTDTFSKTYQVERNWDTTSSLTSGVKTSITAGIPEVVGVGVGTRIEIGIDVMFQFSEGTAVMENVTDSATVELTVPPNHYCKVSMRGHRAKISIPFTAYLRRTFGSGESATLFITGTYNANQIVEAAAVIDRCEILDNSNPCP